MSFIVVFTRIVNWRIISFGFQNLKMENFIKRSNSGNCSSNGSSSAAQICLLKPVEDNEQLIEIKLRAGQNIIGRNKDSGIRDVRCSKRQLELDVDYEKRSAKLRVLGLNPCGINGMMVTKDTGAELRDGDLIEVVYGKHQYALSFGKSDECSKIDERAITESWDAIDDGKVLIYTSANVVSSDKIAGYDIDGTIIKTKSGNVFPKNTDDWQIIYSEVPTKLKRLHDNGFKLCFFTNQGGIDKGKTDVNDFKKKISLIIKKLGVPVQVFIAVADGYYRKPRPGMWEYLKEQKNDGVKIDLNKCFYVGDAAGRPEVGTGANKRRKDHSLADRLFAVNIGVAFYTPEEHFLNKKTEPFTALDFQPMHINEDVPILEPASAKLTSSNQCEMILMVGLPGSGKSHFCQEYLVPAGYKSISSDVLHGSAACLKASERELNSGNSCVIDNTNVDVEARKKFVELAKQLNIPCRCFIMNIPLGHVKHNLTYRNLTDTKHSRVNDMVFNGMKKKFTEPTTEEGFTDIVRVNFKPKFNNEKDECLYKLYLVEK